MSASGGPTCSHRSSPSSAPDERTLLLLSQLSDARAERRLRGTIAVADHAVAVAANGAHPVIHAQALIMRSYLRTIGGSITSDQQLIEQAEHDIAQAIELVDGLTGHAPRRMRSRCKA